MAIGEEEERLLRARIVTLETELAESRTTFAQQQDMIERTSAKIMRDAEDVVRILGELEERDALIARDLKYALRFQRAILPSKLVYPAATFEVVYLPAEIVSGDVYDIVALDDGRLRVFLADATGHGVAAALTTMFIKSQYDILKVRGGSPAEVLSAVNDTMTSYGYADMRFTAICADYHARYHHVTYATAAHPRPLHVKADPSNASYRAAYGDSGGPYLGLEPGLTFPEHETMLEKGDRLYFLTDGLIEATNADGAAFGEEIVRTKAEAAATKNIDFATLIMPALSAFIGEGNPLSDDVTVVGLRPL